jgi:hypothetical protein
LNRSSNFLAATGVRFIFLYLNRRGMADAITTQASHHPLDEASRVLVAGGS